MRGKTNFILHGKKSHFMKSKASLLKPALYGAVALALLTGGVAAQAQVFTETFGTDAARVSVAAPATTGFTFVGSGTLPNNNYTVMRPQNVTGSTGDAYWVNLSSDHTGDTGGALMVVNAGTTLADMYRRDFNALPGHSYRISAWRYVVNGDNTKTPTGPLSWSLEWRDTADAVQKTSGNVNSTQYRQWEQTTFDFTVPKNCAAPDTPVAQRVALVNRLAQTEGNDFYVDDISLTDLGPTDICPPPPPVSVPTLDIAGLGLLSLLGAGAGALALRRRKRGESQ